MPATTRKPFGLSPLLTGTETLKHDEYGVYIRLLEYMWQCGGKLPNDDTKIAYYLHLSVKKWRNYKKILQQFFIFSEQNFSQIELKKAYQKTMAKSRQNAANAAKRWAGQPERQLGENSQLQQQQNCRSSDAIASTIAANSHSLRASDRRASNRNKNLKKRLDKSWQAEQIVDKSAELEELLAKLAILFSQWQMTWPQDRLLLGKWLEQGISGAVICQTIAKIIQRVSRQGLAQPKSFAYFSKEMQKVSSLH